MDPKILGAVGMFLSLWGYGVMMQPRQTYLTATRARASLFSAVLAFLAVCSLFLLLRAAGKKTE